ncbi:hypothetical protein Vadar_025103 [Vaccinium darrowii]|uniref:Uncharacterized protein n=1 Tax=Vaccinium darrowii TaxID=229202 RepID=A0ACB7XC19_9ERIC|nr:hypothetical protein Vadar_025103 [Vaccinium darrowii]
MGEGKENDHTVVMFPFMAQGHIIPFLALALQIEKRGFNIVFVNTPLNIHKLRNSIPPSSAIRLREIPFTGDSDRGLPPDAENTDVLPPSLIFAFVDSSISLKPAFRDLLSELVHSGAPPLAVISDMFFGWSADVAHEFQIFHTIFNAAGGFGMACYHSIWMNFPHRNSDSLEFLLPGFHESVKIYRTQLTPNMLEADGSDPESVFHHRMLTSWSNSDGILFNSVQELDWIGLNYLRREIGQKVWPVGPILLHVENSVRAGRKAGVSLEKCIQWLDSKPPNSVLFISFGSNNTISTFQMMQLARALEQARNTNFIWVVRPPLEYDITAEFKAEEWLPEGFIRRVVETQNRGLVCVQWAPQLDILAHKSVGAFLTHCGWNSVLESLSQGVPLMGWPLAAEQFFNAKFLSEEIGVCVEVAKEFNCEIKCEDLVEKIETVMGEEREKGKEMRRKADEVKEMIRDAMRDDEGGSKGTSVVSMDEFLNVALSRKENMEIGM